jgi:hypothetical protein
MPTPDRLEVLFSAFGSTASVAEDGVHVDLKPDDVLILRLR